MVEVRYRGSFGDNLFQYCFGRLLAERWGHELTALPLPHFPATAEKVSGRRFLSPFRAWSGMAAEDMQNGILVRGHHLEEPVAARLVLYGWFHRWEYFRGRETDIRRWLATAPPEKPAGEGDLAVCLRTRRPESWHEPGIYSGRAPQWSQTLPLREKLVPLLQRVPHSRLVLLTDAPHGAEVAALAEFKPVVMPAESIAAWKFLRTCRRMVISVCHPADWWAAWLSGAGEIYALDPWPTRKQSHCEGDYGCGWLNGRPLGRPDLRVTEPRWIYDW